MIKRIGLGLPWEIARSNRYNLRFRLHWFFFIYSFLFVCSETLRKNRKRKIDRKIERERGGKRVFDKVSPFYINLRESNLLFFLSFEGIAPSGVPSAPQTRSDVWLLVQHWNDNGRVSLKVQSERCGTCFGMFCWGSQSLGGALWSISFTLRSILAVELFHR